MPQIEGIRIQNYGVLKNIQLGKLWNTNDIPLTHLVAVIGENGTGKSTIFDAFGFISDCLSKGVEDACYANGRGGFEKIRSKDTTEPIRFEIYYRQEKDSRPITYEISINIDETGKAFVESERLRQRRKNQSTGYPYSFLILNNGHGRVWKGDYLEGVGGEEAASIEVNLADTNYLGITTLGQLTEHPRIVQFRSFINGWYMSYFSPDSARELPMAGPQRHLNRKGDNLSNVIQYLERRDSKTLNAILDRITKKIKGLASIRTEPLNDGRLALCFYENGFSTPHYAQRMSDGTLKIFSYMLLLEDEDLAPFICIEEPENGLYHSLLKTLAFEFKQKAENLKSKSQIFITTHSSYFIDALRPEEVWILAKQDDGFSSIKRASSLPYVNELVNSGIDLGDLWYSDYLSDR